MRVTANQPEAKFVKRVFVSGEDVTIRCVMVDDEKGEVELIAMNDDGTMKRNKDDTAFETEIKTGIVTIELFK